jgi:hypothetical protein
MNEAAVKIHMMRDQQLTYGMRAAAILGFFAVLCSLSRSLSSIIRKRIYLNTCRFRQHNIIAPQAQMTSSN